LREAAKDPKLQSEQVMHSITRLLDHLEGRRPGPPGTAPRNPSPPRPGPSPK
jgi:hypothetical protein